MNKDDKQKLLNKLNAYSQDYIRFNFRDSDDKQWPDGIAVTLKRDAFKNLYECNGLKLSKMTNSYNDYKTFIHMLKSYSIPYEDHFYDIDW